MRPGGQSDDFGFNPLDAKPEQEPLQVTAITSTDARSGLAIQMSNLPQAAAVDSLLTSDYDELRVMTEPEFLDMIEQWLAHYSGVVATMKSTAASMASELSELRNQRTAVRAFFNTTPGDS